MSALLTVLAGIAALSAGAALWLHARAGRWEREAQHLAAELERVRESLASAEAPRPAPPKPAGYRDPAPAGARDPASTSSLEAELVRLQRELAAARAELARTRAEARAELAKLRIEHEAALSIARHEADATKAAQERSAKTRDALHQAELDVQHARTRIELQTARALAEDANQRASTSLQQLADLSADLEVLSTLDLPRITSHFQRRERALGQRLAELERQRAKDEAEGGERETELAALPEGDTRELAVRREGLQSTVRRLAAAVARTDAQLAETKRRLARARDVLERARARA